MMVHVAWCLLHLLQANFPSGATDRGVLARGEQGILILVERRAQRGGDLNGIQGSALHSIVPRGTTPSGPEVPL